MFRKKWNKNLLHQYHQYDCEHLDKLWISESIIVKKNNKFSERLSSNSYIVDLKVCTSKVLAYYLITLAWYSSYRLRFRIAVVSK